MVYKASESELVYDEDEDVSILFWKTRIRCPTCREIFNLPKDGVAGFPDNFIVNGMMDAHDLGKQYEYCLKHEHKLLEFYCFDCQCATCSLCYDDHSSLQHAIKTKDATLEIFHSEIENSYQNVSYLHPYLHYVEDLAVQEVDVVSNANAVTKDIETECEAVKKIADSHMNDLLKDLEFNKKEKDRVVSYYSHRSDFIQHDLVNIVKLASDMKNSRNFKKLSADINRLRTSVDCVLQKQPKDSSEKLQVLFLPDIYFEPTVDLHKKNYVGELSLVDRPGTNSTLYKLTY